MHYWGNIHVSFRHGSPLKILEEDFSRHGKCHERRERCLSKILELGKNLGFEPTLFYEEKKFSLSEFCAVFINLVLVKKEFIVKHGVKRVRKGLLLNTKEERG